MCKLKLYHYDSFMFWPDPSIAVQKRLTHAGAVIRSGAVSSRKFKEANHG
jgi:hypothetical protein